IFLPTAFVLAMGLLGLLRPPALLLASLLALVPVALVPAVRQAVISARPETVGVASHPDCPLDKYYYFVPHRFPAKQWGALTGKFLTHGNTVGLNGERGPYRGSGLATAYLSGRTACLREALNGEGPQQVIDVLRQAALTPVPEIGYA
ncbi:MAG: hypothetical protein ACK4YP_13645, partial [Myxococcota bacterium]